MNEVPNRRSSWSWWYLLFVMQFIGVLWPPFYDRAEPYWQGVPFFYWYQMLWIVLGVAVMIPVYFADERADKRDAA